MPLIPSVRPQKFVVMGVAGCGKSTIGTALAVALDGIYIEGDALHPSANIEKMSRGTPLDDEDRWPWLDRIGETTAGRQGLTIVGCSALKRVYRDRLRAATSEPLMFLHLEGSRSLIAERMKAREGHFMPASLLDSQFAALEALQPDELGLAVNIDGSTADIVNQIASTLPPSSGS